MDAFEPFARWQPGWTGCGGEVPSFGISWTLTRHLLSPVSLMLRRYSPAFWIAYSLRNWPFLGRAEATLDCIFLASSRWNFASSGFYSVSFSVVPRMNHHRTVDALLFTSPATRRRLSFVKSPIYSRFLKTVDSFGHTSSSSWHSTKVCTDIPPSRSLSANGRVRWENILLRPRRSSLEGEADLSGFSLLVWC